MTMTTEDTAQSVADRLLEVLNRPSTGSAATKVTPVADVDSETLYFTIGHELDVVGPEAVGMEPGEPWSDVPHRISKCKECDRKVKAERIHARLLQLLEQEGPGISVTQADLARRIYAADKRASEAAADLLVLRQYGVAAGLVEDPWGSHFEPPY